MNFLRKNCIYLSALLALPVIASAQDATSLIAKFQGILAQIPNLIIALAVIAFMIGVVKYVVAKDPEKQKEARSVMIYGIIVIFVMVSIWGLVALLGRTLGIGITEVTIPQLVPGTGR